MTHTKTLTHAIRLSVLLFTAFSFSAPSIPAQTKATQPRKATTTATTSSGSAITDVSRAATVASRPAAPTPPTEPTINDLANQSADSVDATTGLNDYIPCESSIGELMKLRPRPQVLRITPYDESEIKRRTLRSIIASSDKTLDETGKKRLVDAINDAHLEGKTQGEALATILSTIYGVDLERQRAKSAFSGGRDDAVAFIKDKLPDSLKPDEVLPSLEDWHKLSTSGRVSTTSQNIGSATRKRFSLRDADPTTLRDFEASLETKAGMLAIDSDQRSQAAKDLQDLKKTASAVATLDIALSPDKTATQSAADAARQAVNGAMQQPPDLGCGFSILTFDETRLAFGHAVADQYIAVQVVVRNVNEKQEFLLHDSQLQADDDINGSIGRFVSGRDRRIVRDVLNNGDPVSVRNRVATALGAVSEIMSLTSTIFGNGALSDAAHTVSAAVVPQYDKLFPSSLLKQVQLVDDLGFAASATFKTVVPKSASVAFVMFIPSKPFEQGWWVQDCAAQLQKPIFEQWEMNGHPLVEADLVVAQRLCGSKNLAAPEAAESPAAAGEWKVVHYKKWKPYSLNLFARLVHVAVSGVHIQEEASKQPQVAGIEGCPKNSKGELDLTKGNANGNLECTVIGQNLDKIAKLKLENGADTTDVAEGKVSTSGGESVVDFPVAALGGLKQSAYKVYAVTKDGAELSTGETLNLSVAPLVTATDTKDPLKESDLADKGKTVTLTGYHLESVKKVCIDEVSLTATAKATTLSFTLTSKDFGTGAKKTGTLSIKLNGCDVEGVDSGQTVTIDAEAARATAKLTVDPTHSLPGATVTLTGSGLKDATVKFGAADVMPASTDDTTIKLVVPAKVPAGKATIAVTPKNGASISVDFTVDAAKKPPVNGKAPIKR